MTAPATYERHGGIARITLDDGKVNVMSLAMIGALNAAFDRAEKDGSTVILQARGTLFSAGFDLKVFSSGTARDIFDMRRGGAELVMRIHEFPRPVVAACHATAYPMGAFPILACDYRIGVTGEHQIGMNEVAIGLTLPRWAIEFSRSRLNPAYLNRATVTGEMFSHEEGLVAGFFDEVVSPDKLDERALAAAERLGTLDAVALAETKGNVRKETVARVRALIDADITLASSEERVARRDAAMRNSS